MSTKKFGVDSGLFKEQINRYTVLGIFISICSIVVAMCLVSFQLTGGITIEGMIKAQTGNPAIWALDATPLIFAYWGQSFFHELISQAENIIEYQEREYKNLSNELEIKLNYESKHDQLTNLPNSLLISEKIQQAIMQNGEGNKLAVIIVNINNFRNVNFTVGTYNANNVLKQFAEKLKSILLQPRMLKAYLGMNMVGRLQGDEFAILLPRINTDLDFEIILNYLVEQTSTYFMIDGINIQIYTTAGIALYPDHGKNAEDLIVNASLATNWAQKEGVNVAFYHKDLKDEISARHIMINELKRAIDRQELEIYYQPNVDLKNGKIIGAEALIRIYNEQIGLVDADKIIPLVENSTLIKDWTRFMLEGSIKQIAEWLQKGRELYISVNISAVDVIDLELPHTVQNLLDKYQVPPHYLRIELTERACLSDQAHAHAVLTKLHEMGIKIIIEDFCSGYSSFVYLTNFPINCVKIDKSFVMNMLVDHKKLLTVQAIIKLAESLNLEVLALGIADKQLLDKLIELNCTSGQGFYFSPAVDPKSFEVLFESNLLYKGALVGGGN